jgi:hypothetical protein
VVVLLSAFEGLVSAVGVFRSFEVVVESVAFALPSAFISPVVVFEGAVGLVESDAFDLLSTFMSPVVFASGLPCAC